MVDRTDQNEERPVATAPSGSRGAQPLADLPREKFRELVELDMRNKLDADLAQQLRSEPEAVERWYRVLTAMKRSVESQLAAKRAEAKADRRALELENKRQDAPEWLQVDADFHRWYAGAIRFRAGMEAALDEARELRHRLYGRAAEGLAVHERNEALADNARLRRAIERHRDHECDDRCELECIADSELWSVLQL